MARAKARKARRARIRKPVTKTEQFQGYCGYCEKWGHKRADCITDGESKGAAAASTDNDGDVAVVMNVDDAVKDTERNEASTGWCFGVSSMCAVLGPTGSLFLDSGSDEHLCTPVVADLIATGPDRSLLKLKDVQQNDLAISSQKTEPFVGGTDRW